MNVKSHVEPFFKSHEKKKSRNNYDGECQCFEEYNKNKDDDNRSIFGFLEILGVKLIFLVSFLNVTGVEVVPIRQNMTKMVNQLDWMQAMTVKEKYVATNVAVNIALRIHMLKYMCTVKSQMFGMGELIITLDAI